jgi:tRNA pseudouridine55 synthase
MVSALKHQGKRLHELARAGIEIERPPRPVRIDRLELLGIELPRIRIRVECSKGTYIRSLAMDIGDALGCGAHLTALRRTRSGPFELGDAVSLEELQQMSVEQARERLLAPDAALLDWPPVQLDAGQTEAMSQGRTVGIDHSVCDGVRMYHGSRFVGLGQIDVDGVLKVRRLFHLPGE